MSEISLAQRIDHTLLKAEASAADVDTVIREAITHRFASVCVNGVHLPRVVAALRETQGDAHGHRVLSCAVAGFPLGAMSTASKAAEAATLARAGAGEIDFVAHLPALLAKDQRSAFVEFAEVVAAVRLVQQDVTIKVILETACLMAGVEAAEAEARIAAACGAAADAGCDFRQDFHGVPSRRRGHGRGGRAAA